jgi:hypothetical protein
MVREKLGAFSVIPARNEDIPIWKTHGRYRKQMKRGYSKALYHQRNKDETIVSMIKRLFGEHICSRHVITQNRELSLRCITYNMHINEPCNYNDDFYRVQFDKAATPDPRPEVFLLY